MKAQEKLAANNIERIANALEGIETELNRIADALEKQSVGMNITIDGEKIARDKAAKTSFEISNGTKTLNQARAEYGLSPIDDEVSDSLLIKCN